MPILVRKSEIEEITQDPRASLTAWRIGPRARPGRGEMLYDDAATMARGLREQGVPAHFSGAVVYRDAADDGDRRARLMQGPSAMADLHMMFLALRGAGFKYCTVDAGTAPNALGPVHAKGPEAEIRAWPRQMC